MAPELNTEITSPSPDTGDGLVARLRRNVAERHEFEICPELVLEAASRISALEGEQNRLIASIGEHVTVRSDYLARAERAEASLAALEEEVEGLKASLA